MQFLISVIVFSAVTLAFLFVERLYRSPTKSRWLDNEFVAGTICVGFTGAFAMSFALVLMAALELPLPIWGDAAAAVAIVAAAVFGTRHLFRTITARQKVL